MSKFITAACSCAQRSDSVFRHGAVIVIGGKIHAVGRSTQTLHAEASAIQNYFSTHHKLQKCVRQIT